jgi:hypothetical protein
MIIAVGGGVIMVAGIRSIKGVVGAAVVMSAPLAGRGSRDGVAE